MTDSGESYSTTELEDLFGDLPRRLEEVGVAASPAEFSSSRQPDIFFVHPVSSVDDVLSLLRLVSPRVVYVSPHFFDPDLLVEESDRELPGVEELLSEARGREGDLFRVNLTWASDGIIHTWFATADWYDALSDEADIAVEAAKGLHAIDRDLRREQYREQFARLKDLIFADVDFRKATVNKRTTAAKSLIASSGEVIEDPWLERHLLRELRQDAALEVIRQEQLLEPQLDELATRLIESNRWVNVPTRARQKTAIASFVIEASNGWMVSDDFIERLRTVVVATISNSIRRSE